MIKLGLSVLASAAPAVVPKNLNECIAKLTEIDARTTTEKANLQNIKFDNYKNEIVQRFIIIDRAISTFIRPSPELVNADNQNEYATKLQSTIDLFIEFVNSTKAQLLKLQKARQNTIANRLGDAAKYAWKNKPTTLQQAKEIAINRVGPPLANAAAAVYNLPKQVGINMNPLRRAAGIIIGGAIDYDKIDKENQAVLALFIENYAELKERITNAPRPLDLSRLLSFTNETSHYFELMIDIIELMIYNYQPPPTFIAKTAAILSAIKTFAVDNLNLDQIFERVDNDTCKDKVSDPKDRAIGQIDGKCRFINVDTNKIT